MTDEQKSFNPILLGIANKIANVQTEQEMNPLFDEFDAVSDALQTSESTSDEALNPILLEVAQQYTTSTGEAKRGWLDTYLKASKALKKLSESNAEILAMVTKELEEHRSQLNSKDLQCQ